MRNTDGAPSASAGTAAGTAPLADEHLPQTAVTPESLSQTTPSAPKVTLNDRYIIESELGRGGMGRVFVGRDIKLGRRVAIKILIRGTHEADKLQRFEQEARAASSLNHPNVLTVYDIGVHDGEPYIVSELLEGATLRKHLEGKPVPLATAIDYGLQLAAGLSAAHERGIVHRDLKPENLFITDDGRLKILDFGIAKLMAPETPDAALCRKDAPAPLLKTQPGSIVGTVGYMSPEQVRGKPADSRSDIFSIGAILYEVMACRRAFEADSFADSAYAIIYNHPPDLPEHVPVDAQEVVWRCLEKKPEERFQSAHELALSLRRLSATTDTNKVTPPRTTRTRRWVVAAAAGALLMTIGIVAVVRNRPSREVTPPRITVVVADFNETDDRELNGLSGMLITSLEQSKPLSVLTRERMLDMLKQMGRVYPDRIGENLARELSKQSKVNALVLPSVETAGDSYTLNLKVLDPEHDEYLFTFKEEGRGKESIPVMIDRLSERTRAALNEKTADIRAASISVAQTTTANLEAYQHYSQGWQLMHRWKDPVKAAGEFHQAVAMDPNFALGHWARAEALRAIGARYADELETALRMADRLPEKERCMALASHTLPRNYAEGLALAKECIARFPEEKAMLYDLADRGFHRGELDTAIPYYEKVLALDPTDEHAVRRLLSAWQALGRFDKAIAFAKDQINRTHDESAYAYLVHAHWAAGDSARTEEALREAARLFPNSVPLAFERISIPMFAGEPEKAEAEVESLERMMSRKLNREWHFFGRRSLDAYRGRFRSAIASLDEQVLWARTHPEADELVVGASDAVSRILAQKALLLLLGPGDVVSAHKVEAEAAKTDSHPRMLFEAYFLQGDFEQAAALVDTREASADEVEALLATASAARRDALRGNHRETIAAYEKLAKGDPMLRRRWLYELAKLYLDSGDLQRALSALHAPQTLPPDPFSLSDLPRVALSFYYLGQVHERMGNTTAALEAYQRFLHIWNDADPDLKQLQDARVRVAGLRRGLPTSP